VDSLGPTVPDPRLREAGQDSEANRERILATLEFGLSNSKLEGLNSKVRLINHRGGHHSAKALIAMIYLCCAGITVELPTDRV
jgi:transposase